jgi:hypothetical protein
MDCRFDAVDTVDADGSYLWTLLGNDGHGRATDVAGAHAADLNIPFLSHGG